MASLKDIRTAIGSTLETALTIDRVKAYPIVESVNVIPEGGAAVVVIPVVSNFVVAMARGDDTWTFTLMVLVNPSDPGLGQNTLDAFVTGAGDSSIRQAIFSNRTLGLAGVQAHVQRMTGYGLKFESAGIPHLGATLALSVETPGTN